MDSGFLEISNKPIRVGEPRNLGRQYLPKSLSGGGVGVIQAFTETLTSEGTAVNTGEYVTHEVLIESNNKDFIIQDVEWGVFVSTDDTFTLSESLLPYLTGISSQALDDWDITGPYKSVLETFTDSTNGRTTPKGKSSERMTVRNVGAGAVTVWFVNQIKYIINGGGA